MAAKKNFHVGDLVWAKMKMCPFWPAKIVKPPRDSKSPGLKKTRHYVFFYGSGNFAWINDNNIVHHSEEMLQSVSIKKKSKRLKLAVQQIEKAAIKKGPKVSTSGCMTKRAPKMAKSLMKPKKYVKVMTNGSMKKIANIQKRKVTTKNRKMPKRHVKEKSPVKGISPHELSERPIEDNSELINDTHPIEDVNLLRPRPSSPFNLHEPNIYVMYRNIRPLNKKIGFIGLGMMGQRLVKNLITTNHKVTVWNRTFEKSQEFAEIGAVVAHTPSEVVETCDIIFCCVSGPGALRSVIFEGGILPVLENSPRGSKGFVEMTTIDSTTSKEVCSAITNKGGKYLEVKINGTLKSAERGTLLIMCAGNQELFTSCDSCFRSFANDIHFLNEDCQDFCKMNIIHNMLTGIAHSALAEAMALVENYNLSRDCFMSVLENNIPLYSPLIREKLYTMDLGLFEKNTSVMYLQKDMSMALSLGNEGEIFMPVTAVANEMFKRAKHVGFTDVYQIYMAKP